MPAARLTLALLLATVAIAATSCGGGSDSVPSDAVAVVDGTEISRADLDELMTLSKNGYKQSNQAFPKAGTPEYQSIQTRNVAYLVELAQFRKAADDLGLTVSQKDIDKIENQTIKDKFGGKRAEYAKALKKAGFTPEQYREKALEVSALSTKIFDAVTKDVDVSDQEILEYYTTNQSQYGSPESRDVRHILIAEKNKDGSVDFEASKAKADEVYAQLKGGADFAALAKQISADPGSKDSGGKLTISRGQTVPEFDKAAFDLKTGDLSKPVKTTYGYHVIEAVSDVRKATTTPIDKVRATIRTTLLQEKRNQEMQKWVEDLKADYKGKVSYAAGYEPPQLPEEPTTTQ
jgi:parvulin-like peptidyl-prolyl isomerase